MMHPKAIPVFSLPSWRLIPKTTGFLVSQILADTSGTMELAFVVDLFAPDNVMNSTVVPDACKARDLTDYQRFGADTVVEVAHPDVTKKYGPMFLRDGHDYMMASTTAFADEAAEAALLEAAYATEGGAAGKGVYLTPGALWGAEDIKRMSDSGKLAALRVTMKKHPDSLYPVKGTPEHAANEGAKGKAEAVTLYDGPVRQLARTFPVNVNTICTAAIAANKTVGMGGTRAVLVADSRLEEMIIEVRAEGPKKPDGSPGLRITTLRENPSKRGAVTGQATLNSFFSSLTRLCGKSPQGDGVHLC